MGDSHSNQMRATARRQERKAARLTADRAEAARLRLIIPQLVNFRLCRDILGPLEDRQRQEEADRLEAERKQREREERYRTSSWR